MAIPQRDKILTSLAGEFFVAGKLCQMGYVASLTLKNYPEVDIFVLNPKNEKEIAIQVKTKKQEHDSIRPAYFVPEKIEKMKNPFIFVYITKEGLIKYHIISAKKLAEISHKERQEYLDNNPHVNRKQMRMIKLDSLKEFEDRWDLLGLD